MKATESIVKHESERLRRRAEHATDTRNALVEAARSLFGQNGYTATNLDEIAEQARVTKGALYHHFASKRDLFRVVVKELRQDMATRVLVRMAEDVGPNDWSEAGDLWERICAGCLAYLDAVGEDPSYQRVVVFDGPAVLSLQTWIEDTESDYEPIAERWLDEAVAAGLVAPGPTKALGHILGALIDAASRELALGGGDEATRAEVRTVIQRMLGGLRLRPTD